METEYKWDTYGTRDTQLENLIATGYSSRGPQRH